MSEPKKPHYELIIGDIMDLLPKYKEKFHLMIADPPFGLEFDKSSHEYGASDYILYDDKFTADEYEIFSYKWISRCFDALTPDGSLYVISGWTRIGEILNAVKKTNFTLLNHIIWHFSWGVFTKKKYVTSHYHILFLVKDKKNYKFYPQYSNPNTKRKGEKYENDVWYWPKYNRGNDPDRIKGHPCQLPIVMLEKIIKISSDPCDWVGDIFSGSGGTILACRRLGRNVIGFEINKEYESIIKKKARFNSEIFPFLPKEKSNDAKSLTQFL
ncbi:MAG: DNA-methyltransferase [Candidatus Helarchaeota archaeon]